jgi:hypothetical protein
MANPEHLALLQRGVTTWNQWREIIQALLPDLHTALTSFHVHGNISPVSLTPQALQALLDELEASRASRKRAWENLQELRWVLKDAAGVELPPPARKTIDLEGRLIKDGVRKALTEGRTALADLVHAVRQYRSFAERQPLTLQGGDYARAVDELKTAIERAEDLLQ